MDSLRGRICVSWKSTDVWLTRDLCHFSCVKSQGIGPARGPPRTWPPWRVMAMPLTSTHHNCILLFVETVRYYWSASELGFQSWSRHGTTEHFDGTFTSLHRIATLQPKGKVKEGSCSWPGDSSPSAGQELLPLVKEQLEDMRRVYALLKSQCTRNTQMISRPPVCKPVRRQEELPTSQLTATPLFNLWFP